MDIFIYTIFLYSAFTVNDFSLLFCLGHIFVDHKPIEVPFGSVCIWWLRIPPQRLVTISQFQVPLRRGLCLETGSLLLTLILLQNDATWFSEWSDSAAVGIWSLRLSEIIALNHLVWHQTSISLIKNTDRFIYEHSNKELGWITGWESS